MARSFQRRERMGALAELNVTALIDLGFALLIIFMISTPLIQQDQVLPVDLPVSLESEMPATDVRVVEITVVPTGYLVDGTPATERALISQLRSLSAQREPPVITIRADRNMDYQSVVTLLDLLKEHRLTKIHLETRRP